MAKSLTSFRNLLFASLIGICSVSFGSTQSAFAQNDVRTEQVRFAAGTSGTTINDTIQGYESVLYRIGAEAGQRMKVRLEPSNTATNF